MQFRRSVWANARRVLKTLLLFATLLLGVRLAVVSHAQLPASSPPATPSSQSPSAPQSPQSEENDVVRITTNLVQVDAVVVNGDGKPVTDLSPSEVQIYEDGKPRKINNFSYVNTETGSRAFPIRSPRSGKDAAPPVRLRPEDVRRTIALVVDDLGLSLQTIYSTRRALKKFVDEQMRPGDLVAIIRTSGGVGALQQFTSDRRQLSAAIEAIKWYGLGRSGPTPFEPTETPTRGSKGKEVDAKKAEQTAFSEDISTVGTLGAIGHVVRGLRELPGRKTVVVISDGIRIGDYDDLSRDTRAIRALRQLIDQAARSSVVINTMNAAGLQWFGPTAADSLANSSNSWGARDAEEVGELITGRAGAASVRQAGMTLLAEKTGGIAVRNLNDLSAGIRRVMDDMGGYYLIGYRPDESVFDARTGSRLFHRLSLKVTRPGKYRVRMRDGFFGTPDERGVTAKRNTPRDQLAAALLSPFAASGVRVQLTSLFANNAKTGSFTRSILYIDANDLTFKEEADGWRTATFDVVTVTFDEGGNVVDELSRTDALRLRGEAYQQVLKYGFVYNIVFPVRKSGGYRLRTVLRDHESGRVGSASQFVEIPDLKKRRLALSGLVLSAATATENAADREREGAQQSDPQAGEAVRHFKTGMAMRYSFVIYNARLEKDSRLPRLQVQVRLFRDGQPVFTGRVQPFALNNPPDLTRLAAGGSITVGADMSPGDYVMQVTVEDLLAPEKERFASQWIDFAITK